MGSCPEKPASIVASEANLPALNPNCAENPVMVVGLCGFSHCVRRSCLAKECLRSDPDPVTGLTSDQDQPCLCECASVWATWQGFQKITHFLFGDLFAFQSDGHQPPLCRQRQMAVAFTHPMAIKERTHTHTKHTQIHTLSDSRSKHTYKTRMKSQKSQKMKSYGIKDVFSFFFLFLLFKKSTQKENAVSLCRDKHNFFPHGSSVTRYHPDSSSVSVQLHLVLVSHSGDNPHTFDPYRSSHWLSVHT